MDASRHFPLSGLFPPVGDQVLLYNLVFLARPQCTHASLSISVQASPVSVLSPFLARLHCTHALFSNLRSPFTSCLLHFHGSLALHPCKTLSSPLHRHHVPLPHSPPWPASYPCIARSSTVQPPPSHCLFVFLPCLHACAVILARSLPCPSLSYSSLPCIALHGCVSPVWARRGLCGFQSPPTSRLLCVT